jgi:glycosyltransferase involved in cell wall biosynthesis
MITENKCGIAVPPEDPAAFADALDYMADHPEELDEMGKTHEYWQKVVLIGSS